MSNLFDEAMKKEQSVTVTENGAYAYNTTGKALLDLFATVGSLRSRADGDIVAKFQMVADEDKKLATKMLFYTRDVRGGLGERNTFRVALRHFANKYPDIIRANMANIAFYGRYDDYYTLIGTPVEEDMWEFLKWTVEEDYLTVQSSTNSISLCGKWLYSPNTSSKEHSRLGRLTAKKLGYSLSQYRHILSALRERINVTERLMCSNNWWDIDYAAVPAQCMRRNGKSFETYDNKRYHDFLASVFEGKTKIKASTVTPGELVSDTGFRFPVDYVFYSDANIVDSELVEAQWKDLPNYFSDDNVSAIGVVDTSGSMNSGTGVTPMQSAVGLGIYMSERCKGPFKDKMITFSSEPEYVDFSNADGLVSKLRRLRSIVDNTNLEKVFELILNTAVKYNVPQSDMPDTIIVFSDMEIDYTCKTDLDNPDFHKAMQKMFEEAGYKLPAIIYWNMNSRHDTFLTSKEGNAQFYSGNSAATFKAVMSSVGKSAYEAMLATLNSSRYDNVVC